MKEIFGHVNLDGCIRAMLHTNQKAYEDIAEFLGKIPTDVRKKIKNILPNFDNLETNDEKVFLFDGKNEKWILKLGAGDFSLIRESLLNTQVKSELYVYDYNEVLSQILADKYDDGLVVVMLGSFEYDAAKKLGYGTHGFEYDFNIESSWLLKRLQLVTEIGKRKDGYLKDRLFDRDNPEKRTSLNIAKCWPKEFIKDALEQLKKHRAAEIAEKYENAYTEEADMATAEKPKAETTKEEKPKSKSNGEFTPV